MEPDAAAAMIAALAALVALLFAARSASAAQQSAEHAETVAEIEREHRHELLSPEGVTPLNFRLVIGDIFGREYLMGVFSLPRSYRVQLIRYPFDGEPEARQVGLVRAHHPQSIPLEAHPAPRGADCPLTTAIRLRFWPPTAEDDTAEWSCLCGRPEDSDANELGHWEVYINVPANPVTARQDSSWLYGSGYGVQSD